jgi:hypothetical protein
VPKIGNEEEWDYLEKEQYVLILYQDNDAIIAKITKMGQEEFGYIFDD